LGEHAVAAKVADEFRGRDGFGLQHIGIHFAERSTDQMRKLRIERKLRKLRKYEFPVSVEGAIQPPTILVPGISLRNPARHRICLR
jgi:hypothetical protein